MNKELLTPAAILIAGIIIGGTILYSNGTIGSLASGGLGAQAGGQPTTPSSPPGEPENTVLPTVTENDHIRGNAAAPVTIIEYSDFECPFCRQFHPTLQQVLAEYGDQVRWVYKHFPLDQIHAEARPAAEASECIAEQKGDEAFWKFGDRVFEQQAQMDSALYRQIAQDLGVNLAQYDTCVSQRKYKDKVEANFQEGLKAGVTGTPGSFVNDRPVRGALPYDQLKSIIDAELQEL